MDLCVSARLRVIIIIIIIIIIIMYMKCTDLATKGENILDTPSVSCHRTGCPLTSQNVFSYDENTVRRNGVGEAPSFTRS